MAIKTLPIIEQWDCSSCGNCCRGSIIPLDGDDLARLKQQKWEDHPEYQHVRTIVRLSPLGKQYRLAQRSDGSCVFLMDDNRCRIHAEHGASAKPVVCQMYPLQFVPRPNQNVLTLRRGCPSAAAEQGRPVKEHRDAAAQLARQANLLEQSITPPRITPSYRGEWPEATAILSLLQRLVTDERFPLTRRLVHGARACYLLDRSRFGRLDQPSRERLLETIEQGVADDTAHVFSERVQPDSGTRTMFRQCAAEYLRLHSTYRATASWRERWRLAKSAIAFARGKGLTPQLHPDLPAIHFSDLEEPLGHFSAELQRPFLRFYEANTMSWQYVMASRPGWPITRAFRAIALAYPIGLWLLRWLTHGREIESNDVVEIITIMDRGQGYATLIGGQHLRRVGLMCREDGLERLIAWYAR